MRIVVTGASGNLGTGVLRALIGHEVVGVCRRPPSSAQPPYDTVEWHAMDVASRHSGLSDVVRGADAVVHLAWQFRPDVMHRVNIAGVRAVLTAVREARVPHVVHASSIAAYAPSDGRVVDEQWPTTGLPSSVYSVEKADAEQMLWDFAATNPGTTVSAIRPTVVALPEASPGLRALFFAPAVPRALFRLLSAGKLPVVPLPPALKVQFVHSNDVGEAVARIVELGVPGPFNLASPDILTAADVASIAGGRLLPMPAPVARAAVNVLQRARLIGATPGWFDVATESPLINTDRAAKELGWHTRYDSARAAADQLAAMGTVTTAASPALRGDRLAKDPQRGHRPT